jgi:hypothetical protein
VQAPSAAPYPSIILPHTDEVVNENTTLSIGSSTSTEDKRPIKGEDEELLEYVDEELLEDIEEELLEYVDEEWLEDIEEENIDPETDKYIKHPRLHKILKKIDTSDLDGEEKQRVKKKLVYIFTQRFYADLYGDED